MNRQELKERLGVGVVKIVFEKADGTLREMNATLDPQVLPEPVASDEEINRNRSRNEEVQVVWDVEAGAWRSFRWDRLKEIG